MKALMSDSLQNRHRPFFWDCGAFPSCDHFRHVEETTPTRPMKSLSFKRRSSAISNSLHIDFRSEFRRLGNGYFQPFGEAFHDRVKIPPRIAVRDGARGVLATNRLLVPDRTCGPDVHEQGMGAEDRRTPVGVLLARGFLRPAVDAGKGDPQLFDDFRVCPVGTGRRSSISSQSPSQCRILSMRSSNRWSRVLPMTST